MSGMPKMTCTTTIAGSEPNTPACAIIHTSG